ncbi:exopolysaccharide biosynthesis polyprenyl glycosylphosphotransferase [Acidisoma cellulosilytica]|uniref:Exopolysaccharide biosynthesis polyprenyl glycosylphosphotransferase n=1 Tax=Acidisoma cellulosilyticum TaxID=2802395 RepID=A0A963YYG8_9PROT|nr:exopolysaccharide biosynthesis polyprenyl glycosylphosphotransferase [Acidisoma cellulosilyticum]MCB8879583.1 exopolysaccharide biosynthesis polyprenyl glycosylphosphotransferase [Acidisoma cellulosilyticum]
MELSRRDIAAPGAGPQRLFARHPAVLLGAWDAFGIIATGLACRSLNPASHAGQTLRAMLVILGTAALGLVLLHAQGFYREGSGSRQMRLLFTIAQSFALMLLMLLMWEGFMTLWPVAAPSLPDGILVINRNWLFSWSVTAPSLIMLTRPRLEAILLSAKERAPMRRAVLVADRAGLRRLGPVILPGGLLQLCGVLEIASRDEDRNCHTVVAPAPVLPSLRDARAMLERGDADLLLIALPETAGRSIAAIDRLMAGVAADIWLAPPDAARFYAAGARLSTLGGCPFVPLRDKPMAGIQAVVKRAEDLCLGLPLLILAAPPMLLIALAIRLSSKGPVLFVQPRLGLNRRVIPVRKFRTMRIEAGDAGGVRQAVVGDRRVTRLGRFLRRTSLDELPQLINVVEGSMSLVGPRPHALGTEAGGLPFSEAAAGYAARHRVKPGMTGWAQVCGWRGETNTVDKLRRRIAHDLHYIAHWSLGFDLRILVLTIRAVLRGEGV